MNKFIFVAAISAVALAGCATAPEAIAPAYISEVSYQSWSCRQLGEEEGRLASAYEMAAAAQHHARTNDTIGIIFLGLPVSSLSGSNVAPQVANLKGQQVAVQRAATLKNCATGGAAEDHAASTAGPTSYTPAQAAIPAKPACGMVPQRDGAVKLVPCH
jgi:hypothetical protein